jgi:nitronate monooxygenase
MLSAEQARTELQINRQRSGKPFNVNFFCHKAPQADAAREGQWVARLAPYRDELGVDHATLPGARAPFDETMCALIEELRPPVVSFHFGLPDARLVDRVRRVGSRIIASATTVAEARWLEEHGVDAVIAQGAEAGGHRGMFLSQDIASQPGTFALVPQVVDAVRVPVIAAGGIGDPRGIVAALALGAAGVQIGTAYLLTPESTISPIYRAALRDAREDQTILTNVFTGRPARGILNRVIREVGPISDLAPAFPNAASAMLPLRLKAEAAGSGEVTPLWSGQAPRFAREIPAGELTRALASGALERLR